MTWPTRNLFHRFLDIQGELIRRPTLKNDTSEVQKRLLDSIKSNYIIQCKTKPENSTWKVTIVRPVL